MDPKTLLQLLSSNGRPLVVVDHKVLRENYQQFRTLLPRVQAYYASRPTATPRLCRRSTMPEPVFDVASRPSSDRSRKSEHASAGTSRGFSSGTDHLREPDQSDRTPTALEFPTSLWSPTILRRVIRSPAMRPHLGPCAAVARSKHRIGW